MEQILQVAAQAVQTGNCEAALAVCQTLMSAAQGGMGPGEAPQEEPTFARNGSKLRRVRKSFNKLERVIYQTVYFPFLVYNTICHKK